MLLRPWHGAVSVLWMEIENGGSGPAESMHEDVTSGYLFVLLLESSTARQAFMPGIQRWKCRSAV